MGIQSEQILVERYQIAERLGKGGMARTFAAHRLIDDLPVVIKELHFSQLENWKAYELFQREIKTLKSIKHPAIPKFLDSFEVKNEQDLNYYLVIERVPGDNLIDAIDQNWRPSEAELKQMAYKLLDVLSYLHTLAPPVIHRDIKPSNIIRHGSDFYLIDFGAVLDMIRPEGSSTVVGTFGYMAPEQFTGRALPASDLYGLGATLLHILAGRPPAELPQKELRLDFRSSVSCSSDFANWLERMLEPAYERRFQTASEAQKALFEPVQTRQVETRHLRLPEVRQPAGSKVKLERTSHFLKIHIPAGRFNANSVFMTGFATFWLVFVSFWTFMAAQASIVFAAFSIPFWVAGFVMAGIVVRSSLMHTELLIDSDQYQYTQKLGRVYQNKQVGLLHDITAINRNMRYKVNNAPVFALCLEVGSKQLYFGGNLSRAEQGWVQNELLRFMTDHLSADEGKYLLSMSEAE